MNTPATEVPASPTLSVLTEVLTERQRQDVKFGEQNHEPTRWVSILAEEFGEAAMAANDATWPKSGMSVAEQLDQTEKELIETAAVAVAAVESLRRNRARILAGERL